MLEMDKIDDKSEIKISDPKYSGFQFETRTPETSQNLPLSIKEVSSSDLFSEWGCYVQGHPQAHFFCHPLWVKALENEYGLKASVLVCQDINKNIRGVLPLMPTRGLPFKKKDLITSRRFSALPRTPLGGFLFDDERSQQMLLSAAIEKVSKEKDTNLQLKSYFSKLNENIPGLTKIEWRPSFCLELPDCPTKIRFGDKKRHHKVKWAVNKAISLGINIREAESEQDLKEWYKLYIETVRWHMVAARPYRFFKFLFENLVPKGIMKLLLAECSEAGEKRIIAGSVFLSFNDTVFYSFNGRNQLGLINHANDLIQWEAIHTARKDGFKFYDMGEVSGCNASLAQFKSKWGCGSKQIYHYYFSRDDGCISNELEPDSSNKLLELVWRKLPLKLTQEWGILTNRFL